jgi:hypothetical protein
MTSDFGHWLVESETVPEDPFGFVYLIENKSTGRKYIGKKQCKKAIKRKPLKGKTRCRRDSIESDWKQYTGSSNELNSDIEKFGKESFTFKILEWCDSKFELGYKELKQQVLHDVLLRGDYYNGIIQVRLGKAPKYLLEEHKKLSEDKG